MTAELRTKLFCALIGNDCCCHAEDIRDLIDLAVDEVSAIEEIVDSYVEEQVSTHLAKALKQWGAS